MLQQNYLLHSTLPFTPKTSRPIFDISQTDILRQQKYTKNNSTSQQQDEPITLKHSKKHTQDEGFTEVQQQQPQIVILKQQQPMNITTTHCKKFIPYRIKQPKIKLTFISKQSKQQQPLSATLKRQYNNKSLQMKKTTRSKPVIFNPQSLVNLCVIKLKRNFIGDNLTYHHYGVQESKLVKAEIVQKGSKIVYEVGRQQSTFAYLSLIRDNFHKQMISNCNNNNNNIHINTNQLISQPPTTDRDHRLSSAFGFNIPNNNNNNNTKYQQQFFLDNHINQLLKIKHKDSFIFHKQRKDHNLNNKHQHNVQDIVFDSEFQSANLQIVSKVINAQSQQQSQKTNSNNLQYNLHLRNDTNTKGHQNWFYFRLKNTSQNKKRVKLNIVNIKRNLNLIKQGQKIYTRIINKSQQIKDNNNNTTTTEWILSGENIEIKDNKSNNIYKSKVRILSFQLDILPNTEYQVSILPPYTYSQMLKDVQGLKDCAHARVDILTYSLVGMAIPLVTFTNFQVQDDNKQVILISARIHPGETVASFIIKGFMQALKTINTNKSTPETQDFLNLTIIKIIPMINPDGVVFGNFRTNYLGYDLNRCFHTDDEITNPEIMALKQLGRKLKKQHGEKFNTFIDLHGHSSEKNIFTYGPDFENGNQKFYKARLLPKILNSKSPYFKYNSCTFKLEQYKMNTARGFFLNTLNVTAFTIESSYAIYQTQQGKNQLLTPKEWMNFGQQLLESFQMIHRLNKTHNIKNRTQLKRAISLTEEEHLSLLNTLKKEMKKQQKMKKSKKPPQVPSSKGQQDSDGQDENQDLNPVQRDQIEKKLVQNTAKNYILPKVFKPSILYPTVTPKLFNIGQTDFSNYKILYTRRNRYQSIKMPASNYLHSLQGMQSFKPKARNIKLQKKIQFV